MSKPKPRVTIVGLGLIGTSIGMALHQAEVTSAIVGHDKSRDASAQAKKNGAVDRTEWNLISACEQADLIVLATPVSAIEDTLKSIAPYLRPQCVLIDTASLKMPVLHWAAEHLPDTVHFVGGDPIISKTLEGQGGVESASADLFQNALFCLVPSPDADAEAVKLATDLVRILGARPVFFDAAEHDGLVAAVEHLPTALSLTLVQMVVSQPTWRELRKVAGPSFEASTRLASSDPAVLIDMLMSNRDNLVRWIDTFVSSLTLLRQQLADGQEEELAKGYARALAERDKWLVDRAQGYMDDVPRADMPERPNLMDTFLGNFWRRNRKRSK
jgi:prephenate dehydrogenase